MHFVPSMQSGGIEQVLIELAHGFGKRQMRNIVVSAGGRLAEKLERVGTEHITLDIGKKSLSTLFKIGRVKRLIMKHKPDVLHVHSRLPAWIVYFAWRLLPKDSRPALISTVHGFYSINAYSGIMTKGERVIAVSNCIRDYIMDNYPSTPADKIDVIPNSVDPLQINSTYRPSAEWLRGWNLTCPELRGKFTLCLPGRVTRLKGHLDAIPLLKFLLNDDIPAHLLIVGEAKPGKEAYKREVEEAITKAGMQGHVTWAGHRADLREIMCVCDVVLSLSQAPESFGKTTLDALALGKPVAGYAHGGVKEQLDQFLPEGNVEVGDIAAMAALIKRWYIEVPKLDPKMPYPYTIGGMINSHLETYRHAISSRIIP